MSIHSKKKFTLHQKPKSPLFSSVFHPQSNITNTHLNNAVQAFHLKAQQKKQKPTKVKATSHSPIKLNSSISFTKEKIKEKTLVIDLDETLVHSDFNYFYNPDIILKVGIDDNDPTTKCDVYVSIRPGVKEFLSQLSNYYEIIFFTASCESYAKPLMNYLDEKKVVSHKLFRDHCTEQEGVYIKDLSKLSKDLKNIVLLDNNIYSFAFQRENGIPIRSWYGDYNDIELYKLIPLLKNLSGFYDVRTEIPKFVTNNTFIWMKGINWLKEHLLNTTYYVEVENVMQMERRNCSLSQESMRSNNNVLSNESGLTPVNRVNSVDHCNDIKGGNNKGVYKTRTYSSASKEKDNDDCIKITNNFFYDNSSNIKIIDDNVNTNQNCQKNDDENIINSNAHENEFSKEEMTMGYAGLLTEIDKQIDDEGMYTNTTNGNMKLLRKSSSLKKSKYNNNNNNNNINNGNLTTTTTNNNFNVSGGYLNLRKHPTMKQPKQSIKKTIYNNSKNSLYKIFPNFPRKKNSKDKNKSSFVNLSKEEVSTLCHLNMSTGSTSDNNNTNTNCYQNSLLKVFKLKKSSHHLTSHSNTTFNSNNTTSTKINKNNTIGSTVYNINNSINNSNNINSVICNSDKK
jgi:RNA polymerase II subunit A small phosphatase-like protein